MAGDDEPVGGVGSDGSGWVRAGRLVDAGIAAVLALGAFVMASRLLGWMIHPLVVLAQSALPVTMIPVWLALPVAAARRLPVRAVVALVLCVSHAFALAPAMGSRRLPVWAAPGTAAATLRLVSANVFEANHDPGLGGALLAARPDVLVLVEVNDTILEELDASGLFAGFAHVARSGNANSVVIASKLPLDDVKPGIVGGVAVVSARVAVGGKGVRVIAAHPRAPSGPARMAQFRVWMRWARDQARVTSGPLVMAGDFNASRFVPVMGALLAGGFTDAHESRGSGLSTSWPAGGPFFDLPFMRLDHVLMRGAVVARSVRDLTVPGSDHLGIVAVLAVR